MLFVRLSGIISPVHEIKVDKYTYRMDSNNGVLRLHWLSSDELAISPRILSLRVPTMFRSQALKKFLDRLGEPLISSDLGDPACVAACSGDSEKCQDRDCRWLMLEGNIGVVAGGCQP